MDNGWVKAHRKLIEWEWYDDSKMVHLYLHCLLKANHKPNKWRGIVIESGQFVTSYSKLSCELPMTVQQIRTSLNKLKSTSEVTIKSTSKYSIISITNWDSYQQDNKQTNKQITNEQQSNNIQVTTNKNEKNDNKDKKKGVKRFTPPSLDEVKGYILEKQYQVDAERFLNHYESNGWMVGKTKMKNWKAAVSNWNSRNKEKANETNQRTSTPKAKQFSDKLDEIAARDIAENGFTATLDN